MYKRQKLDSIGLSAGIVGLTLSNWVEIGKDTQTVASCPQRSGKKLTKGSALRRVISVEWKFRVSVGLNPGIGLLSWDIGASIGDTIYWDSMQLGYVTKTYPLSLLFVAPIEVFVDNVKVRGIGTYINGRFLKVIFTDSAKEKPWKEGDEVEIKVSVLD